MDERIVDLLQANQLLRQQIDEREEAEEKLAEVRRRLAHFRENERAHLARELHDGPLQELGSIVFSLSLTQQSSQPEQAAALESIKEQVVRVSNGLRMASNNLRPPILVDFGLLAAMRAHAERFQEMHSSPSLALFMPDDGSQCFRESLPEEVELSIYRIYQQALRNVVQHADAGHVWVRLSFPQETILLEIEDDGCGFTVPDHWVELARGGHIGVVGMVERADMVGGRLTIESQPGEGTRIQVSIPLAPLTADEPIRVETRGSGASPASAQTEPAPRSTQRSTH